MIKGIVFDMDGLMFDTERLSKAAWAYAGEIMGLDITEETAMKTLGVNAERTKEIFREHIGKDFNFEKAKALKVEYMNSYIEREGMPIKTGLKELLEYLKMNDYKITVATSSEKERAEYYFEKAGISGCFERIVSGDMVSRSKPEPDIFLKASEIIGVAPEDCIALEDSPMGIISAYRAHLKPVMIPDLVQPDEEINKLLYAKLTTLSEVIEFLSERN